MPAAARVTDAHTCPVVYPSPHVGGVLNEPSVSTVVIGYQGAATVGTSCVCPGGPPNPVVKGSLTVKIGHMDAARLGDATAHGGTIITGFATVVIGG